MFKYSQMNAIYKFTIETAIERTYLFNPSSMKYIIII